MARFLSLYSAYKEAKYITLKRLYLEAMEDILPHVGKIYVIDKEQKNLLNILDLSKEIEKQKSEK